MRGLNLCLFAGNLGNDPELKYMPSGGPVCSFSLAISSKFKGKDGEDKETVEWIRVACFAAVAESCSKFISKGDAVFIVGRLRTREYEDKEGKKKITEVIADRVQFLTTKSKANEKEKVPDEDVPF